MATEEEKAIEESVTDLLDGIGVEEDVTEEDLITTEEEEEVEEEVVEDETAEEVVEEETIEEEIEDASETVVEEEVVEEEVVEEEVEEDEPLTERELAYLAEIERLSAGAPAAPVVEETPVQTPVEEVVQPEVPQPGTEQAQLTAVTLDKIMEGLDFDDVVSDPKIFMKVLENAIQVGTTQTVEAVYKNIPRIVQAQVQSQTTLSNTIKDFYDQNPDLAQVKSYVGRVANDLAAKNPDWDVKKLFDETATTTRKALRLRTKIITNEGPKSKSKPGLVKKVASNRGKKVVKSTGLQKEIDDLIS